MIDNFKNLYELSQANFVLGQELKLSDSLSIIPVFRAKLSYFSLETSIKENDGNAASGTMTYEPICFIQIQDGVTTILAITSSKENVFDHIPQILNSFDFSSLIKGLKV